MGLEIERKFLVDKNEWEKIPKSGGVLYRQGYIFSAPEKTLRVRVSDKNGFLTLKGKTNGASRSEYEYPIPKNDALELLDRFCEAELSKIRYEVTYAGKLWEVDVFVGANEGLIVAEIELTSEDEPFEKPGWALEEVTDDNRYYNANLVKNPFKNWH